MHALIPAPPRVLCPAAALAEGTARGFAAIAPGFAGLFLVRKNGRVFGYVNACPHLGVSLEWTQDRFLSADGTTIVCAMHAAVFRIADGACLAGPCAGEALTPVAVTEAAGMLCVPADAGRHPATG
ncbi:MAG: Rieske (2Fe-2S) protein [Acetobacteraceae bacterium]